VTCGQHPTVRDYSPLGQTAAPVDTRRNLANYPVVWQSLPATGTSWPHEPALRLRWELVCLPPRHSA